MDNVHDSPRSFTTLVLDSVDRLGDRSRGIAYGIPALAHAYRSTEDSHGCALRQGKVRKKRDSDIDRSVLRTPIPAPARTWTDWWSTLVRRRGATLLRLLSPSSPPPRRQPTSIRAYRLLRLPRSSFASSEKAFSSFLIRPFSLWEPLLNFFLAPYVIP